MAGGQPGHQGQTLHRTAEPNEVIELPKVSPCSYCQADLNAIPVSTIEPRQVEDVLAPPRLQVRQYEGEWKWCPQCQRYCTASFSKGSNALVQYGGPRVGALAVSLSTQHLLPPRRTREVLANLLSAQISEATITHLIKRTAQGFQQNKEEVLAG